MLTRPLKDLLKPDCTVLEYALILRALHLAHGVIEQEEVFPEIGEANGSAKLKKFNPHIEMSYREELAALEGIIDDDNMKEWSAQ